MVIKISQEMCVIELTFPSYILWLDLDRWLLPYLVEQQKYINNLFMVCTFALTPSTMLDPTPCAFFLNLFFLLI